MLEPLRGTRLNSELNSPGVRANSFLRQCNSVVHPKNLKISRPVPQRKGGITHGETEVVGEWLAQTAKAQVIDYSR
jgi:hypothetical protein